MKTINATTQRGERFINDYNRATAWALSQVYGRYSCAKARAERDCRNMMTAEGLRIETGCNSYVIPLN